MLGEQKSFGTSGTAAEELIWQITMPDVHGGPPEPSFVRARDTVLNEEADRWQARLQLKQKRGCCSCLYRLKKLKSHPVESQQEQSAPERYYLTQAESCSLTDPSMPWA